MLNPLQMDSNFDVNAYFKALVAVAMADGEMSENEVGFIREQADEMSVEVEPLLEAGYKLDEISMDDASDFTRRILIRDCIRLAHADGHYDGSELVRIAVIAEKVGVDPVTLNDIEQWLRDFRLVMARGEELFCM